MAHILGSANHLSIDLCCGALRYSSYLAQFIQSLYLLLRALLGRLLGWLGPLLGRLLEGTLALLAVHRLGSFLARPVFALFLLFYPVLSGQPVEASFVSDYLRWLPGWVLTAK